MKHLDDSNGLWVRGFNGWYKKKGQVFLWLVQEEDGMQPDIEGLMYQPIHSSSFHRLQTLGL